MASCHLLTVRRVDLRFLNVFRELFPVSGGPEGRPREEGAHTLAGSCAGSVPHRRQTSTYGSMCKQGSRIASRTSGRAVLSNCALSRAVATTCGFLSPLLPWRCVPQPMPTGEVVALPSSFPLWFWTHGENRDRSATFQRSFLNKCDGHFGLAGRHGRCARQDSWRG